MNLKILFLSSLVIFMGCGGAGGSGSGKIEKIKVDSDEYLIKNLDNSNNINININKNNKELYLLLTNTSNNRNYIKINQSIIEKNKNKNNEKAIPVKEKLNFGHTPQYIIEFNHQPINRVNVAKKTIEYTYHKKAYIGENRLFYLEKDMSISTKATLRKIVRNIETEYGNKTLNVWVSDDSFGDNCSKLYCVKQNMVEALADTFLKDGDDNDIYDWVTNILGKEWGEVNSNSLIDNRDEITILLTDIDNDNRVSGGAMQGYFYAKDNYKKKIYSGSNEQVMLYIDSVMFASHYNGEWSMENPMTKKIVSTLAHEFAHMIQFYQKNVCLNTKGLKPWIDEMIAVEIEDIIANKLKTTGIRGVSYTRGDAGDNYNQYGIFPLFNENINKTLPIWNNKREDYAMVSAFGSYLIRNYGGAELLHNILHNRYTDEKAIVYAVNKSPNGVDKDFDTLIRDWGIAVLLSSKTTIDVDSGYLYNLGDFIETDYKKSSYSMGSINFFNYYHRPNIVNSVNYIEPKSNLYYKISKNITGEINIEVKKSSNIKMALVVK